MTKESIELAMYGSDIFYTMEDSGLFDSRFLEFIRKHGKDELYRLRIMTGGHEFIRVKKKR